jgi:hypothetical protein
MCVCRIIVAHCTLAHTKMFQRCVLCCVIGYCPSWKFRDVFPFFEKRKDPLINDPKLMRSVIRTDFLVCGEKRKKKINKTVIINLSPIDRLYTSITYHSTHLPLSIYHESSGILSCFLLVSRNDSNA